MAQPRASKELLDALNKALAAELQSIIQYMWQHVMVVGLEAETVGGVLKGIAVAEMQHAERVAERINYLGGVPTVKPALTLVGGGAMDMLDADIVAEETAVSLYAAVIARAKQDGDDNTAFMAREITLDEQGHHDTLLALRGKKQDNGKLRAGD